MALKWCRTYSFFTQYSQGFNVNNVKLKSNTHYTKSDSEIGIAITKAKLQEEGGGVISNLEQVLCYSFCRKKQNARSFSNQK